MGLRERLKSAVVQAAPTGGSSPTVSEELEWGLVLPGGATMWNTWNGVSFDNPLDRLHMVARLQKTADEVGFGQEEFLSRYNWVTRKRIYAEAHENGPSYVINAPEVSEQKEEES